MSFEVEILVRSIVTMNDDMSSWNSVSAHQHRVKFQESKGMQLGESAHPRFSISGAEEATFVTRALLKRHPDVPVC